MEKADLFLVADKIRDFCNTLSFQIKHGGEINGSCIYKYLPDAAHIDDFFRYLINDSQEDYVQSQIGYMLDGKTMDETVGLIVKYTLSKSEWEVHLFVKNRDLFGDEYACMRADDNKKENELYNKTIQSLLSGFDALIKFNCFSTKYLQSREPEEEQEISTSKKGRKESNFRDFFKASYASRTNKIIDLMKTQMEGRTGKNAAIVLIAAIKNGYIRTPEKGATDREFGRSLIVRKDFKIYLDEKKSSDLWNSKDVEEMQYALKI